MTNVDPAAARPAEMTKRVSPREMRINILIWGLIAILGPSLVFIVLKRWVSMGSQTLEIGAMLPREVVQMFLVLIGSIVVARREGVGLGQYGLPGRGTFGARYWEGAVWGFVALSALIGMLIGLGTFHLDSVALVRSSALAYGLGWGVAFTVLAIWEEFFFRGYLMYAISRRAGFWVAAGAMSIGFGVAHLGNHGETVFGIAQVVLFGLFACFALRRTGSLWFPIGYHAAWDWAQTYFYGTPDSGLLGVGHYLNSSVTGPSWLSGGTGGPEGSVLCVVVLGLSALAVHLRFPRVQFPIEDAVAFDAGAVSTTEAVR
jgi:uncharacterized protein